MSGKHGNYENLFKKFTKVNENSNARDKANRQKKVNKDQRTDHW